MCRGHNPDSDNALFGKDDLSAVPLEGQLAVAYGSDRFPCSRRCMPSWHCIRAWEPVRLKSRQQKKLRTVTGAVICRKDFALIHDRDMKRHKAKRREASMRPDKKRVPVIWTLCQIPVLLAPRTLA